MAQIALGLHALHTMGIIHRNIKPENILYDPDTDTVRISNLDVAYLHTGNAPLERGCLYTTESFGSKSYRAPEIINEKWYGVGVDWWSLGCTMFDLITGEVSPVLTFCLSRTWSLDSLWQLAPIQRRQTDGEVSAVGSQGRRNVLPAMHNGLI